MKKINKKAINVMATAALVASLVPTAALANSTNLVDKVPSVKDDFKGDLGSHLIVREDDTDFSVGQTFRVSLPQDVEWLEDYTTTGSVTGATYKRVSDRILEFTMTSAAVGSEVKIPLKVELDGAEGAQKVTIDALDSTVTSGEYVFANVGDGDTTAVVEDIETISGDNDEIGVIRIDENSIGALHDGNNVEQEVTFKLPANFEWVKSATSTANVALGGGFTTSNVNVKSLVADGRTITLKYEFTSQPTSRGSIYFQDLVIDADKDADFGDVEVSIDGDNITSEDLIVANYSDYDILVEADGEVPTILAGRDNTDTDDLETVEVKIDEAVAGSILNGRDTVVTFPSWVKVVGAEVTESKGLSESALKTALNDAIEGDDNEIEFEIPDANNANTTREFNVKFLVSVEADKAGDITAEFSGRQGLEGEVVVAKAVAPVTVEVDTKDVRIGVQDQEISDIIITESAKEGIKEGEFVIELPDGVEWAGEPTIEVLEGNLEVDEESVEVDDEFLTFELDGESTKPSKIKISNAKIDITRSVPEGIVDAKVGGSALVFNDKGADGELAFGSVATAKIGDKTYNESAANKDDAFDINDTQIDVGEFDKDYVAKVNVAKVVTPASGDVKATVQFTIDNSTYTVNGVEKTADVAPFIQNGRTFLPVRFVAEAVGVGEDNIIWNDATDTVTLIKGDRIAQVVIGSKSLVVNGVTVQMDVAAAIKDGRTVLPLRYVAQALGAEIKWDDAARTVTIN